MRRPSFVVCLAVIAAVACGAVDTRATGYFNLPGTHAQWAGHGFGGGYHAPLLLGPMRHDGPLLGNQVRLPYSPVPCCGCYGCSDCGRMVESPTAMPEAVSSSGPAAAPVANSTVASAPAPVVEGAAPAPVEVATPAVEPTPASTIKSSTAPSRPIFPAPVQP